MLTAPKTAAIVRPVVHENAPHQRKLPRWFLSKFGGIIGTEVAHVGEFRRRAETLITSRALAQVEVSSGLMPNLKYLLYSNGDHRWLLRFTDPKSKKKTCRILGSGSMAQAIAEAVKIKELIKAGQSPSEARITLAEYFDSHYRAWAEKHLSSAADSVARFDSYIRPAIGHLAIADLTLPRLRKLVSELPDRLAPATKNKVAAVVKAVIRQAHENGFVAENSAHGLRIKKTDNARDRVASSSEIRAIFDSIKQEPQPSLAGLFIRFLFYTACRSGEARNAKFDDIEGNTLTLRKTKSGKDRVVDLNEGAQMVITELRKLRTSDYLFPGCGERIMERPTKAWNRILIRAGILEPLTLHDIRRSSLSIGVNGGGSMFEMATLAGHASIQTTYDHYLKADDRALRRASRLIQDGLPAY